MAALGSMMHTIVVVCLLQLTCATAEYESADLLVALVTSGRLHIVEPRNVNEAISSSDRALQACRISPNCASMWMAKLAQICLQLEHCETPCQHSVHLSMGKLDMSSSAEDTHCCCASCKILA